MNHGVAYFIGMYSSVVFIIPTGMHCGHTIAAIWLSSLILELKFLSHHVQFLHLNAPKRLGSD